jgi:hypothetical protein
LAKEDQPPSIAPPAASPRQAGKAAPRPSLTERFFQWIRLW